MSKIRVLSDHLANQIAAGEVVERPASVLKELLENALDAGADRISIQVEGGGTRLIRVADNGVGMDQDDVLLSLERHATSKLTEESQLAAITTLGFRGEALPSIGAVSRMSILSRTRTAEIGTRAEMRYGTLHDLHDDGCAGGTVIEVCNLFGNLPARKKFLKTKRTELFHIEEVIRNQALAYPDIAFFLQVDGRKSIALAATDQEQRIRDVFRYSGKMLDITSSRKHDTLRVKGSVLLPDAGSSAARLRILVNNRPVQDRMIRYAVIDGLKGLLMKRQQPAGALLLELDSQELDINVHPAKREIRFRKPDEVRRFLVHALSEAVLRYQEEMRSELFIPEADQDRRGESPCSPSPAGQAQGPAPATSAASSSLSSRYLTTSEQQTEPRIYSAEPLPFSFLPSVPAVEVGEKKRKQQNAQIHDRQEKLQTPQSEQQPACSGLKLIGQFLNLYLLCEHDEQLVLIDQHAAHERILYQQLRTAYEQRRVAVQRLLFPVTVELGPGHADILEQEAEAVADLGFEIDFFGESTWVIKAVPAMVGKLPPREILFDALNGLAAGSGTARSELLPEYLDRLLASMACKAAVKSGHRLQPEEMLTLLRQMKSSAFFSHCPHGRPVLKTFSRSDVEKWFRRT